MRSDTWLERVSFVPLFSSLPLFCLLSSISPCWRWKITFISTLLQKNCVVFFLLSLIFFSLVSLVQFLGENIVLKFKFVPLSHFHGASGKTKKKTFHELPLWSPMQSFINFADEKYYTRVFFSPLKTVYILFKDRFFSLAQKNHQVVILHNQIPLHLKAKTLHVMFYVSVPAGFPQVPKTCKRNVQNIRWKVLLVPWSDLTKQYLSHSLVLTLFISFFFLL